MMKNKIRREKFIKRENTRVIMRYEEQQIMTKIERKVKEEVEDENEEQEENEEKIGEGEA